MKQLQNKQVLLVKVPWQHHGREEATWESEETMKAQYLQQFDTSKNFKENNFLGGESCNTPN